jgi:hypothetical protein
MIETIERRSRGQAQFLDVREVENFFLDVDLLTDELAARCEALGLDVPSREMVEQKLNDLLTETVDIDLFPGGPPSDGIDPAVVARGSKVLASLYGEFALSEYDKVRDGEALARRAMTSNPGLLDALTRIVKG